MPLLSCLGKNKDPTTCTVRKERQAYPGGGGGDNRVDVGNKKSRRSFCCFPNGCGGDDVGIKKRRGGGEPSVAISSLGGGGFSKDVVQSSLPESSTTSLDIVPETAREEPQGTHFETAREEPQGTGFETAREEPQEGTGFETAREEPQEGTGFETAREEPAFPQGTDFSHLSAAICKAMPKQYLTPLCAFHDCFESVLSGVSFRWGDIFKEPLSSKLFDVPHIPETFTKDLSSLPLTYHTLSDFVLESYGYIVDSAFDPTPSKRPRKAYQKSDVSMFFALATALRITPLAFIMILPSLRKKQQLWYQRKVLPLTVWMLAQASRGNSNAGLFSWARNLLPLLGRTDSQSRELILHSVEKILENPVPGVVVVPPWKTKPLIPPLSLEILLRLRFPASEEATARFARIYNLLKDLALEGARQREEDIQQIFTFSLKLAGEKGNPDLAKEAASIAIWSLKNTVVFRVHWYGICKKNVQGTVALLKTVVEKWQNHHSLPFIRQIFAFSLTLAGQRGKRVLAKEATAVAIWSLIKFSVCWKRWDKLCGDDLEASVGFLKLIVKKRKNISLKLSSSSNKAKKQFVRQIFTFSLRLAGKGDPVVAKEAAAIWSLTENVVVCCNHWDNIYDENIEASVALLEMLVEKWKDHSVKLLSSSPSDTLTLSETIKSFRLKNEQAIPERGAYASFYKVPDDGSFHKVADKSCKVILGRLSRGSSGLKATRFIITAAVTAGVLKCFVFLVIMCLTTPYIVSNL